MRYFTSGLSQEHLCSIIYAGAVISGGHSVTYILQIYCSSPHCFKGERIRRFEGKREKKYRRKGLLVPPLLSGGGVLGHRCFFAGR